MTEVIRNPAALDSQNLIRESLRMSNALRQSNVTRKSSIINNNDFQSELAMKRLKLKLKSNVHDCHISLKDSQKYKLKVNILPHISIPPESTIQK
jgi:hypothetical protein